MLLTARLGDIGKKIHSGRSRNDQVLVDLKLYMRDRVEQTAKDVETLIDVLLAKSEEYKDYLIPGYTHFQIAMPSSMGLWFGAYAESLVDDLHVLKAAYKVTNKNPLGSAAGYGSSFPLDRTMTTELLGFEALNYNVVYAQMSRGKTERVVSMAIASIASTLARMSMDVCLYMNQNFGFLTFPKELTTGSSIMPHKKNPDVFELIRGKCNILQSIPNEIALTTTNLPSGYHREMQLIKEHFFPSFDTLKDCMEMAAFMFENIQVNKGILDDPKYDYTFSVEMVNNMVLEGIPFRDAYKKVGEMIDNGTYEAARNVDHTHEGSIGNLCTAEIKALAEDIMKSFDFDAKTKAIKNLLA
jgi:argininosuccinate lyase